MRARVALEARVIGPNLHWLSSMVVISVVILSHIMGDLVPASFLIFEVIFPFYASICVAEWGRTRADPAFDVVVTQARSTFGWLSCRFLYVYGVVSLYAMAGIAVCCWHRAETGFWQLLWVYLTTSLLFCSLSALGALILRTAHLAVAITGVVWLFFLAAKSMVRYVSIMRYVYPFLRLVAQDDPIWPYNKALLICASALCWVTIYTICRIRRPIQD